MQKPDKPQSERLAPTDELRPTDKKPHFLSVGRFFIHGQLFLNFFDCGLFVLWWFAK